MEQRRVKSGAVEIDRFRPFAVDCRTGHKVIVGVLQGGSRMHNGVDQVKRPLAPGKARGEYPAGIRNAAQIQLTDSVQRRGGEFPVRQIAGMVDEDARKPLEGGGGEIIVFSHPDDGGIGVKAGENRVADCFHIHCLLLHGKGPAHAGTGPLSELLILSPDIWRMRRCRFAECPAAPFCSSALQRNRTGQETSFR